MANQDGGAEGGQADNEGFSVLNSALEAALAQAEAHVVEKERASQRDEIQRRIEEHNSGENELASGSDIRGMTEDEAVKMREEVALMEAEGPALKAAPQAPEERARPRAGVLPVDLRERARQAAEVQGGASSRARAPLGSPAASPLEVSELRRRAEQLQTELQRERERVRELRADLSANRQRFQRISERHEESQLRFQRLELELPRRITSHVLTTLLPALDAQEAVWSSLLVQDDLRSEVREGLEMVRQEWERALERVGVKSFDARGQRFDPVVHEAISKESGGGEAEEGSVLRQAGRGYLLEGRLLRSAQVVVATSQARNRRHSED